MEGGDRSTGIFTSENTMTEPIKSADTTRFGRFELSADTGELRKDGIRRKLVRSEDRVSRPEVTYDKSPSRK